MAVNNKTTQNFTLSKRRGCFAFDTILQELNCQQYQCICQKSTKTRDEIFRHSNLSGINSLTVCVLRLSLTKLFIIRQLLIDFQFFTYKAYHSFVLMIRVVFCQTIIKGRPSFYNQLKIQVISKFSQLKNNRLKIAILPI